MLPHRQPWKTLHLSYFIVSLVVKLLFWVSYAILFPSSRPNGTWSAKKTVSLYVTRQFLSQFAKLHLGFFDSNVDIPDGTYKNTKFVWIENEREENIYGHIKEYARRAHVEPLRTSAFWYYRPGTLTRAIEQPKSGEKVIYYIHGGAFFVGISFQNLIYVLSMQYQARDCTSKGHLRLHTQRDSSEHQGLDAHFSNRLPPVFHSTL